MFSYRFYALSSITLAALALGLAVLVQYGLNLAPCPLCLYQRTPYLLMIPIAGMALLKKARFIKICHVFLLTLWGISFMLGGYHAGVEAGFWTFAACTSTISGAASVADLATAIASTVPVSCDKPAFLIGGMSMADMNTLLSFFMTVYGFFILKKQKG